MDNSLSKYVGRDDLVKSISSLEVIQGKSKTGSTYYALRLKFINGYDKLLFAQGAENFAYTNAFDLITANEFVSNAF